MSNPLSSSELDPQAAPAGEQATAPMPLLKSGELIKPPFFAFMLTVVQILERNDLHVLQLEPEFHDRFGCTGCGQCCQRPWWISLTREYYDKWYKEFDSHPSGLYREPFLLRGQGNDQHFADVRRKPGTHECIFLMDDRRCFIHANYGPEALSSVCQTFPRYEGWFGSFLGRFMLNSCPEVELLVQDYPGIRYHIGILREDKYRSMGGVSHPLGLFKGYLWLGLQLDLIYDSKLSPVQSLRWLMAGMRKYFQISGNQPFVDDLPAMHAYLRTHTVEQPELAEAPQQDLKMAYDCLNWILTPYEAARGFIAEVQSGWRSLPVLSEAERLLLNSYLRGYLAYRALTMNYYATDAQMMFFPAYFLLAANLAVLQWLALYYREREGGELNREHLLRASTVVGYRFEHATQLIAIIRTMKPGACLDGVDNLLHFDFGSEAR